MNNNPILAIILVVIIIGAALLGGGIWFYAKYGQQLGFPTPPPPENTLPQQNEQNNNIPDNTLSDGTISIDYSLKEFGLATNQQQILVTSYIPPCDAGFNYCFYYNSTAYRGTNFESAGLAITKKTAVTTEQACLTIPPTGYSTTTKPDTTETTNSEYAKSVFLNIGDAAAGHYSNGSVYRLFVRSNSNCYEFQTRIGQSQFANFPSGTIKEFTQQDQAAVTAKLRQILNTISLTNGTKNVFLGF